MHVSGYVSICVGSSSCDTLNSEWLCSEMCTVCWRASIMAHSCPQSSARAWPRLMFWTVNMNWWWTEATHTRSSVCQLNSSMWKTEKQKHSCGSRLTNLRLFVICTVHYTERRLMLTQANMCFVWCWDSGVKAILSLTLNFNLRPQASLLLDGSCIQRWPAGGVAYQGGWWAGEQAAVKCTEFAGAVVWPDKK